MFLFDCNADVDEGHISEENPQGEEGSYLIFRMFPLMALAL